jgi:hypothetical protein
VKSSLHRLLTVACALTLLIPLALLVAGSSGAAIGHPEKKNPGMQVVRAFGSAGTAGAIATATATCPKTERPDLGPWRAISAGVQLPPSGSGVVYESRKVGQRSWRASAQSLWGTFTLELSLYCQNEVPKTTHASATVATPGSPQVGPAAVARCRSGKTVAGGFSTPPPFTAGGAANLVIASMPKKKVAWKAQVLSRQASSLTSYVYCAKRKHVRLGHSGRASGTATADGTLVDDANTYDPPCPVHVGRFLPGGGGFSEEGLTTSQYLIPVSFFQQGDDSWHASGLKVGSGVPVTLEVHTVCG